MRICLTALLISILFAVIQADAMSLDEYLQQVSAKHRGLQALDQARAAASQRREAGDIDLSPVLTAQALTLDDRKPQPFGSYFLERNQLTEYQLGVSKKFSTGTQAAINAQLDDDKISASDLSKTPPVSQTVQLGTGSLGISLSQSLWKDAFGSATRLREARLAAIEANERQSYNLQGIQIMVEAESAYWDYLYLKDELEARRDSLDRAQKIEAWIRRRVGNGIGDDSDLYNAQGLAASRQLELLATENDFRAAEKKLRDQLELSDGAPTPDINGDIGLRRSVDQMAQGSSGRRVRLDAYLAVLDAKTKAIAAGEVADAYKPDLVVEGKYNTNAAEGSMEEARNHITDTPIPTTSIGIRFSWALDGDLKNAARGTARSEALAAALKQERALLESDSSWSELKRQHLELSRQIEAATRVDLLQTKKAQAQRDKLSKGRSITSDVILAEQDAAEAHLTLNKLRAAQRKLEAQGRMYVTMEDK